MLSLFSSPLTWWQWLIFGLVPPAIVALYFLKLKRVPLEVPSTYLWQKSIEDLHVNSLWQRLRQSLLLWLQLLLLAFVILALLNPSWRGATLSGNRFVLLIDNSASMGARDVETEEGERITRLEHAKRRVARMIDAMKTGDAAMLVTFSDDGQVVQEYTANHYQLRRRLDAIQLTNGTTSLTSALRLAAGLANPGRSGFDSQDASAATAKPAEMYVFSDFRFPDVPDFSLGNLDPNFELIGSMDSSNIAIVALTTRRHEERPDRIQAFARLENHSDEDVTVEAELFVNGDSRDVKAKKIPGGGAQRIVFTIEDIEQGVLELRIDSQDALAVDDRAWTVVIVPRRSRLLFVTLGNTAFERALSTAKVE